MQNFKSGRYINQGYYSSFSPNPINRNWKIDDMEVITLLSKAHQLGVRSSNAMKILNELYKSPLIDANKVAKIAEISTPSAYKLIDEMQRVGLLVEVTGGKRSKVFLLQNYFQIFNKQVTYDK